MCVSDARSSTGVMAGLDEFAMRSLMDPYLGRRSASQSPERNPCSTRRSVASTRRSARGATGSTVMFVSWSALENGDEGPASSSSICPR